MTPGSSMIYEESMKLLAASDYQVIAIDTPGYGDSDSIGEDKTIEDYSEIISEVIKALMLKKVHLVGLSTGSVIAAATAINYRDFIDKLILVEPGIFSWYGSNWILPSENAFQKTYGHLGPYSRIGILVIVHPFYSICPRLCKANMI